MSWGGWCSDIVRGHMKWVFYIYISKIFLFNKGNGSHTQNLYQTINVIWNEYMEASWEWGGQIFEVYSIQGQNGPTSNSGMLIGEKTLSLRMHISNFITLGIQT